MVTREWGDVVYAPPAARSGRIIRLESDEAHHLFRVLRASAGQKIRVTDGAGLVCECTIAEDRSLEIIAEFPELGEPDLHICLCMAVLKAGMDREIVDLATQLGASEIAFFNAARCEGKLLPDKLEKLRNAAITAIKQCGRSRLPHIRFAGGLKPLLASIDKIPLRLLAHPVEGAEAARKALPDPPLTQAAVVVGPEGGFTDEEVKIMLAAGCQPLSLGRRRLRSQVAVAASLSYLLGRTEEICA